VTNISNLVVEELTLLRPELDSMTLEGLKDFANSFHMFFKRLGITQHIIKIWNATFIPEGVKHFFRAAMHWTGRTEFLLTHKAPRVL
jgi:hypothetical protein